MNHNNNWNRPAANISQHSAGSVAFYDPILFNPNQITSSAALSTVSRPFVEHDPTVALQNGNENVLQSDWNDQWNYGDNSENTWLDSGVPGQPQDSVDFYGGYGQHVQYQQLTGHPSATDGQWAQDNASAAGYDASGFSQSLDQYADYPNTTGSYYDPHMYPLQPPVLQHSISTHSHNSFPGDGYTDQFLQMPNSVDEHGKLSYEQQEYLQPGFIEQDSGSASVSGPVNGNLKDELPKVNTFEASLYQPSPFDDVLPGVTVTQAESVKRFEITDQTHSRNSSSGGGVHFLIGGSENNSGCASHADSPFGFMREQIVPKIASLADSECADEIVSSPAESSSADVEIVAAETHSASSDMPPKALTLHSTMAGTPAGNQFRIRKPESAGNNGRIHSARNEHLLDTSSAPLSQSSSVRVDPNQPVNSMQEQVPSKAVDQNNLARAQNALHLAGDSAGLVNRPENYHPMFIQGSHVITSQESSFIPVESASQYSAASPPELAVCALERESTASESSHLDAEEIENDALRDSGHINAACAPHKSDESVNDGYPVMHGSPLKTVAERSSGRTNFNTHRVRQEATLSPATTLWENPEPAGVQLLPTLSAGVSDAMLHDERSSAFGFLQNTGTGPSRTLNPPAQLEPTIALEVRANDPHIPQVQDKMLPSVSRTVFSAESNYVNRAVAHHENLALTTSLQNQLSPPNSVPIQTTSLASAKLGQADQHLENQMPGNQQPFLSIVSPANQALTPSSEVPIKQTFSQHSSGNGNQFSNSFQAPVTPESHTSNHVVTSQQVHQTDNFPQQSEILFIAAQEPVALRYIEEAFSAEEKVQSFTDDRQSTNIEPVKSSLSKDNIRREVNPVNRQSSERGYVLSEPVHQNPGQPYIQNIEQQKKMDDRSQIVVEDGRRYGVRSDKEHQQTRPDSQRPNYQQGPEAALLKQGDRQENNYSRLEGSEPDYLSQSDRSRLKQDHNDSWFDREQSAQRTAELDREMSRPNDPHGSGSRRAHQDPSLDRPQSRQGDPNKGMSRRGYEGQSSERPQSRQDDHPRGVSRKGYEDRSSDRPQSRHDDHPRGVPRKGYEDRSSDRPLSRQDDHSRGVPRKVFEEKFDRPNSRQDESYNKSGSRRGYEDQSFGRARSRQDDPYKSGSRRDYEDQSFDRPRSRQDDPYKKGSRRGNEDQSFDRPRSRQDDPYKSGSRRGYEDQSFDRPRSRQDDPYKSGSRRGYEDQSFDRPYSRLDEQYKGPPRKAYDDPSLDGSRSKQGPHSRLQERDSDSRYQPRSRLGYPDDHDRDHRRYDDGQSKRHDLPDDGRIPNRQRWDDENYQRPRSRQDDRLSMSGDHQSRGRQHRSGDWERPDYRGGYGHHGEYAYDENAYRAYYQGYPREYDYYGAQYSEAAYYEYMSAYDPYRFNKGYYSELGLPYSQPYPYDPRYNDSRQGNDNSAYEQVSRHSSRASVEDLTAADHFAKTSLTGGSRPSSILSGGIPSVISNSHDRSFTDYEVEEFSMNSYPAEEVVIPQRLTPHKFIIPHMRISFGSANRLIRVLPNNPLNGQPALLEIIDFAELVSDAPEASTLKQFPGPLVRVETHKNDVLHHCQQMTSMCRTSSSFIDRQSAELLWRFLELLIKQNGTLIGTDIADLLLEGHESTSQSYSRAVMPRADSSDRQFGDATLDNDGADQSSCITADRSVINPIAGSSDGSLTDRFRHLLLHGHKKDALDWAMKKNLWGHALFLASKMDAKTHASVLTRFANVSMKMNDPLQTLYQLMSGRQPAAATLSADEKWGDWRPHLSIILSNPTARPELDRKSIVTLGDALASRGLFYSAHFCYLVVSMMMSRDEGNFSGLFGPHSSKGSKLVLIGANHSLSCEELASNLSAIQCTEVYEYSMSLGNPQFILPSFQLYRFLYLIRLIDNGLLEEALRYAEVLSRIITYYPQIFDSTMARSVYQLADKLRYCDPQRMMSEETGDPEWLQHLFSIIQAMENGQVVYQQQQQTFTGLDNASAGQQLNYLAAESAEASGSVNVSAGYQQVLPNPSNPGIVQKENVSYQTLPGNMGFQPQLNQANAGFQPYGSGIEVQKPAYNEQPSATSYSNAAISGDLNASYSYPGHQHVSTTPGQSPGVLPDNRQPALVTGYETVPGQQTAWNPYQRLQSVPESNTTDGTHADQGFPEFGVHGSAMPFGAGVSTSYDQGVSFPQGIHAPPTVAQVALLQRSVSRQRTVSSSSSTHSYNASRRGSLIHSTHEHSPSNTPPVSAQASNESSPRSPVQNAASSVSSDLFQFGVPPPPLSNTFDASPLGANLEQKKKQYWPGEEHDDRTDKKTAGSIGKPKDNSGGWFSGWFANRKNRPKEMILPDDKNPSIVWDPVKNRYVNKDEDSSADSMEKKDAPPPTDSEVKQKLAPPAAGGGQNVARGTFNMPKVRGARNQYVDVLGATAKPAVAPSNLFSVLPKSASMPASIFMPHARAANQEEANPVDAPSEADQYQQSKPSSSQLTRDIAAASSQAVPNQAAQSASPPVNTEPVPAIPSLPLMFNPSMLSGQAAPVGGPVHVSTGPPGTGLHYGQRRQYPRK